MLSSGVFSVKKTATLLILKMACFLNNPGAKASFRSLGYDIKSRHLV